ncbi:MAG: hypothetical protein WA991_04030 [Ornithinimicrobium sp.]
MEILAFYISAISLTLLGGVATVKTLDQKAKDQERRTYSLTFPASLDNKQVMAWLRSLSGTLQPHRLTGHDSIVFEVCADSSGIRHYMKIPWRSDAEYVIGQLSVMVPGVVATREATLPKHRWRYAVELGMSKVSQPLDIASPDELSARLLTALTHLADDEALMMQWVITSAHRQPKPHVKQSEFRWMNVLTGTVQRDVIEEERAKLSEANMLAVMRVASQASSDSRARHIAQNIGKALRSTKSAHNSIVKRLVPMSSVIQRIEAGRGLMVYPAQLSLTELSALIAWPLGSPFVPGLPQSRTRQMPANKTVPTDGLVVGHSNVSGHERPIGISFNDALLHTYVGGRTGVGKSEVLAHVARQAMHAGAGVILMETEGDLYQKVLDYVPSHRIKDVILLDVRDSNFPVGFNVLDQGNPDKVVDELISLLQYRFGSNSMGIWSKEYLYHGLKTIAQFPGLSFVDILPLLNPSTEEEAAWADEVVRNVEDHELKRWWQRHENRRKQEQQQRADPVLSRVWELISRPELRYIMGQSESSFQMRDVLQDNKVLLINLKGAPEGTVSLAGTLLMNAIWSATKSVQKSAPTYVLLDEFGDFMDLPINTESMLAQARKHRVGMVLATQYLDQLKPTVRDAVLVNTGSKLIMKSGDKDARLIAREMSSMLNPEDFVNLQRFEAIAQVATPTGTSPPMTLLTTPPAQTTSHAARVVATSRNQYGKPLAQVRDEIERRNQPKTQRKPKPAPGSVGWDDI